MRRSLTCWMMLAWMGIAATWPLLGQDPEKADPRFEPREKFGRREKGDARLPGPAGVPSCGGAYVGPRGTFCVLGPSGNAEFLWPMNSPSPLSYREQMALAYRTKHAAVYQLLGRFYRVYFAFDLQPDAAGKRRVWVKNGDIQWRPFDTVTLQPPRR